MYVGAFLTGEDPVKGSGSAEVLELVEDKSIKGIELTGVSELAKVDPVSTETTESKGRTGTISTGADAVTTAVTNSTGSCKPVEEEGTGAMESTLVSVNVGSRELAEGED